MTEKKPYDFFTLSQIFRPRPNKNQKSVYVVSPIGKPLPLYLGCVFKMILPLHMLVNSDLIKP